MSQWWLDSYGVSASKTYLYLNAWQFIYEQAWANWQVQATKQQGKKPLYPTFKKFFDKKKLENEILGIESPENKFKKDNKLIDLMKKANN